MKPLVAIVGPTAIGKSQLALRLAQNFNGEIVSADSRQVYRYLDIGTAKPSRQERALVPHHLIDIIDPDEDFSLAQYQKLAKQAIDAIHQQGKLPILAGGSGLYLWSVLEGWQIPHVPPDPRFRQNLLEKAASGGAEKLYQELKQVDPLAAQSIDPRNVRRLVRAFEVQRLGGVSSSPRQRKEPPSFNPLIIGLTTDRAELYHRVDQRVDHMVEQGLVEEVKKLMKRGYGLDLPAMSGIGYRQIGNFLKGEITLAAATEQIKFETHRFVRHQYNWFRLSDKRIHWFDIKDEAEPEITQLVAGFIGQ